MSERALKITRTLIANASLSALWLLLIGFGFVVLLAYQTQEGEYLPSPQSWPDTSSLQRSKTGNTALLFLHPKCPCSTASLHKFAKLLSHHGDTLAYVLFIYPEGTDSSWQNTRLTEQAQKIANLTIVKDQSDHEMSLFKAATSGLVLNYDHSGNLTFAGGITPGRGHEGDSQGADELDEILSNREARKLAVSHSNVYGCPLKTLNLRSR